MSDPPTHLSPGELWASIAETPRPHDIVPFPREKDGKSIGALAIVVLTPEEQFACSAAAGRFTRALLKDPAVSPEAPDYSDIYQSQAAIEVLLRAAREPRDLERRCFPSVDELRRKLTGDELAVLFRHYLQVKATKGPIISRMEESQVEAWVHRLKEAGSVLPLGLLSLDALEELTLRLAFRLHAFLTDTSSAGAPPSSGSASIPEVPEDPGISDAAK